MRLRKHGTEYWIKQILDMDPSPRVVFRIRIRQNPH
jgi:hypothetical protein